ncbi:amphi-Trp domain-containing protein [Desulfovibrio sp. OttesenSCG-928-I05]|nr:amphi-Trp domain-containing protein [Desulfovibrio sp. OttesenSCG-928-I05]
MSESRISLQTRLSREDVAGLIEALLESLKEGRIDVQKSDAMLTLDVPRVLDLEMEGGFEDGRAFFRMDMSWFASRPDVPGIAMPDLGCGSPDKKPENEDAPSGKRSRK